MQPVLGETRGFLGHRGSHYTVRSDANLPVCEEEQEVEASSLPSSPITHVLCCTLPAFVLLRCSLGSVRRYKNAINFKKKKTQTNECPWCSVCYVVRSDLSAQCCAWLQVPLRTLFHPPPAWWLGSLTRSGAAEERCFFLWERSFWSPTPSQCLMGAPQEAEFVGDPFLANPLRGCRRKQGQSDTSPALSGLRKFRMNCEKLEISNMAPPGHSLGGMEAKTAKQGIGFALNLLWSLQAKGECFPSWQEWMWQQRRNEGGRWMKGSAQRWHPWG